MTHTIEVQSGHSLKDLVSWVKSGTEVVLTENRRPVARVVASAPTPGAVRTAGLHRGAMTMAPDFDEPLPEDFWTGEE